MSSLLLVLRMLSVVIGIIVTRQESWKKCIWTVWFCKFSPVGDQVNSVFGIYYMCILVFFFFLFFFFLVVKGLVVVFVPVLHLRLYVHLTHCSSQLGWWWNNKIISFKMKSAPGDSVSSLQKSKGNVLTCDRIFYPLKLPLFPAAFDWTHNVKTLSPLQSLYMSMT